MNSYRKIDFLLKHLLEISKKTTSFVYLTCLLFSDQELTTEKRG